MSEIANRIKSAIKKSRLSHRELETITGIPHSAIQRYAAGTTDRIPISRLVKLANALGTTAAYLLGWEEKETIKTNNEDIKILELIMSLSVEKKKQALDYIQYLASSSEKNK